MKTNLAILVILIGLAAAYTWYEGRAQKPVTSAVTIESARNNLAPAPDFTFTDLSGKKRSLSDFKGQGIVLNFWATWCAPCVIEFPAMLRLADMKKDTVFLFISLDQKDEEIKKFLTKHGRDLPKKNVFIGRDDTMNISAGLYKTYQLPETYLIDSNQKISDKIIGADVDWTSAAMLEKVQSLTR